MEQVVASHLHPNTSVPASAASLPSKANRFQSGLTDKSYKAAALTVRAMNASSLLMAKAELDEKMTAKPVSKLWEEICVVTDHCLHLHTVAVQATGRAMGLMVLQERARWLNLTNLATRDKDCITDGPDLC